MRRARSARGRLVAAAGLIAALAMAWGADVRADYQGAPACPRGTVHETIVDPEHERCMRRVLEQRSREQCPPDRSVRRCVTRPGAEEYLRCPRGTFLRDERCWPIR